MPIYEYRCVDCDTIFDVLRPFTEADAPVECPHCQGNHTIRAVSRCAAFARGSDGETSAVGGGGGGGCAGCAGGSCATCGL